MLEEIVSIVNSIAYDVVVLAANRGGGASGLANTDEAKRGALSANEGIQGVNSNFKKVEKSCKRSSIVCLMIQLTFASVFTTVICE